MIHGAWHGGWCWKRVKPLLEKIGYTVYTPTLPGHETPPSGALEKVTLHAYTHAIGNLLADLAEPAILIGHSMGGIVLSQVAEEWPERIEQLLYVSAFLPPSGSTAMEMVALNTAEAARLEAVLRIDQQRGICTLKPDLVGERFYHDCAPEDIAYAQANLCPQALVPLLTPIETTAARFGHVRRSYIQCLNDRVISIEMQQAMCRTFPCPVRQLASSHSPFFSQPERLVEALLDLVGYPSELVR